MEKYDDRGGSCDALPMCVCVCARARVRACADGVRVRISEEVAVLELRRRPRVQAEGPPRARGQGHALGREEGEGRRAAAAAWGSAAGAPFRGRTEARRVSGAPAVPGLRAACTQRTPFVMKASIPASSMRPSLPHVARSPGSLGD